MAATPFHARISRAFFRYRLFHQALVADIIFQKPKHILRGMTVVQLPFRDSTVGNLEIFTELFAVHAGAFPLFSDFASAIPLSSLLSPKIHFHGVPLSPPAFAGRTDLISSAKAQKYFYNIKHMKILPTNIGRLKAAFFIKCGFILLLFITVKATFLNIFLYQTVDKLLRRTW